MRRSFVAEARAAVLCLVVLLAAAPFSARAAEELTEAESALLFDMSAGAVLYAKAPDQIFAPASLTKIMTATVVFDALRAGRLRLDDRFIVSESAWRRGGAPSRTTSMFAALGSEVRIGDLLQGLIVQSANDAALVLADAVAGSEEAFAGLMNERAKALGMTRSQFKNATGYAEQGHHTTARDLVTLIQAVIRDYPEFYTYYAQPEFTWNKIRQLNKNPLLNALQGVDGLASGGTTETGFGIAVSASRNDRRLILVLAGAKSDKARVDDATKLIQWGYDVFEERVLFAAGAAVTEAKVFGGESGSVPLLAARPVALLVPRGDQSKIVARVIYTGPLIAPVPQGMAAGTLKVWRGDTLTLQVPLRTGAAVSRGGITQRAFDGVSELVRTGFHALLAMI